VTWCIFAERGRGHNPRVSSFGMGRLEIERVGEHEFAGRNERGATVRVGRDGAADAFSPGELMHLAAAACVSVTVEELVTRRAGADARVVATTEHTGGVTEYDKVEITLEADLSFLDDKTRERVLKAMQISVDRQCSVSRTLKRGIPVELTIDATDRSRAA
jgi:uncharacterized OsmC-like protein